MKSLTLQRIAAVDVFRALTMFLMLFVNDIPVDDYDVIFVGYPIWCYTLPQVMFTLFDKYDFSGKVIIPFNTHEGSRDCGTYKIIQKLEPNAKVLEGLAIRGFDMEKNQDAVIEKWLNGLDF